MIRKAIPPAAKARLRGVFRRLEKAYIQLRYGFGRAELRQALVRLGLNAGDIVFVHSSHAAFGAFKGKPTDVIATLQEIVGRDGTLLMPTFTISGSAVEYAKKNRVFDPATSASQVGFITEIFRRSENVQRSIHPTHSVAAWGREASDMLRDNEKALTPCGRGTPLHRLLKAKGKVLLMGVDITALSLFHTAEELLEPVMPFSPFTQGMFYLRCRVNGDAFEAGPMRLYEPAVSKRRRLQPLVPLLKAENRWREVRVGNLPLILLNAAEVFSTLQELSRRGVFLYEGE